MMSFMPPSNKLTTECAEALWNMVLSCDVVYEEYVLKGIILKEYRNCHPEEAALLLGVRNSTPRLGAPCKVIKNLGIGLHSTHAPLMTKQKELDVEIIYEKWHIKIKLIHVRGHRLNDQTRTHNPHGRHLPTCIYDTNTQKAVANIPVLSHMPSPMSIDDAPFRRFSLALNQLSTQCPTIPPQLHATPTLNTGEETSPYPSRRPRGPQKNTYRSRSPPINGIYTPNTKG